MDRRTLTMNWDALGDDDDYERFFESCDRLSSAVSVDLASSGSDDEDDEFEDSRLSFASAISSASAVHFRGVEAVVPPSSLLGNYDMWMAEPGDLKERRKRLLQGMGLASNKDLVKLASSKVVPAISKKIIDTGQVTEAQVKIEEPSSSETSKPESLPSTAFVLVRSRSDGDIESFSINTKRRKEELIGSISKQRLTRTLSGLVGTTAGIFHQADPVRVEQKSTRRKSSSMSNGAILPSIMSNGGLGSFFLIKNLDTGKEFIVKEFNEEGMWNKLSDLQTGKQLTMEEFEKSVGYSPVVKELMRRENVSRSLDDDRKMGMNSYLSRSLRYSKRRGVSLLRNIKGVANSMSGLIAEKERENPHPVEQKEGKNSSKWIKVRHQGKSCKEFTALHLCQEIQAHDGCIWTMKFSLDARYLASGGEDGMIQVWEVQECDVMHAKPFEDSNSACATPVHPLAGSPSATPVHPMAASISSSSFHSMPRSFSDRPPLAEISPFPSEKRRKGKFSSKKKSNSVPDYAKVPETVFALSEMPVCSLRGHLDDVLDLSWSKSQLLLSSSMDKTVRLWDIETKSCLKLFAHNDYVTCIQFNPIDDDYFISGSLDAKVRIWNVSARKVVDWTDLHEMVTSISYNPDGQGAVIGSHKGTCRFYSTADCKLEQKDQIEFRTRKKTLPKKVTGFQFSPWNPTELLITSADSRIRIYDGLEMVNKFRGFRNTSSQIAASFSPDGKYVITASEDSQVYIWRREELRNSGAGKSKNTISIIAHETFTCRDVSVAIPWPGYIKNEPPTVEIHSKKHTKRSSMSSYSANGSPTQDDNLNGTHSKRLLPPLPRKNRALEGAPSCQDDEFAQSARTDSGIGDSESLTSASSSLRYGDSPSISPSSSTNSQSWSSSWNLFDGGASHGANAVQATAWGMVIVTASLGGEIRVYQNFGLPLKVSRQTNLFRDLT